MWRLTLAQMRRSLGRLTAAGIAIAIGTAFVAATLLAGDVMRRISYDSITASYGTADLIGSSPQALTDATMDAVRSQPGVAGADPRVIVPYVHLTADDKQITQTFVPVPSDDAFDTQQVTAGELPTGDDEIALPERSAERLGVALGDRVTVSYNEWQRTADEKEDGATVLERNQAVTVVALTTDPTAAWAQYDGVGMSSTEAVLRWSGWGRGPEAQPLEVAGTSQVLIALEPGADTAVVQDAVRGVLATGAGEPLVLTRDAAAERAISGDGTSAILLVVLAFAAVAMVVAGLVIANTFQVLVAQRTRMLALLRCVGAVRSQVRRSVLLEATILGAAASAAGALLGTLLVQLALLAMRGADLPFPVPAVVRPTVASVLAPLLVGTVVTVLAALTPARVATRVAPVAALRPADAPAVGSGAGRVRLVLSLLAVVGGAVLLAAGVVLSRAADPTLALGVAFLGGAASFIGVLVSAVFWMPKVVAAVGGLVGRSGVPARLAAANTGRNPARTAATSTALLIGVTLVTMMSTGAVTSRATLDGELDARFPVDLQVSAPTSVDAEGRTVIEPLPAGTADRLREVAGVSDVAVLPTATVAVGDFGETATAVAVSPEQAADVLRDPDLVEAVTDAAVVVPSSMASYFHLNDGDTLALALGDALTGQAEPGAASTDLRVVVSDLDDWSVLVTPGTLDAIGSAGTPSTAWVRVADIDASGRVVQGVQDLTLDSVLDISGAAVERALYQRTIDVMLAVVVGLLAVAVVIALIGVTNTLSLSVIERRRESATLRALGLTRRQLRSSMAVEGALIAGVGAVVGVLLGLAYGWLGSASVLASLSDVQLRVPWRDLAAVLLVALVAGVLASVLPGRSAARTPPVAALAVD
jgi:putative ABC transport system permease protein